MAALWVPLILMLQLLMGRGLLRHGRIEQPRLRGFALALLLGMPLSSLVVLVLDMAGIRLTLLSVLLGFAMAAAVLDAPWRRLPGRARPASDVGPMRIRIYEWPFLAFLVGVVAISAWRAFYLPVTLRDAIVGLDLVAKYAAEQGTLRSTVFQDPWLQGHLSNQPFYAPFPMLMQVVFRLAGLPFGQLWLGGLFLSFVVFCYSRLRENVHPVLAGVLMVLLLAVPEMYAHTFMVLNDYPAAVFFGLAVIFFLDWDRGRRRSAFLLSALFMGFACWSRSDTIVFAAPGALLAAWRTGRTVGGDGRPAAARRAARHGLVFAAIPAALVLLWHGLYLGWFLRQGPGMSALVGRFDLPHLLQVSFGTAWLFTRTGTYGYLALVFFAVMTLDAILGRDRAACLPWIWMAILYLGFVAILSASPAASLEGTLKRGFFRFFPLMAFALSQSRLVQSVSRRIADWEGTSASAR
jgi:hypothetical protein